MANYPLSSVAFYSLAYLSWLLDCRLFSNPWLYVGHVFDNGKETELSFFDYRDAKLGYQIHDFAMVGGFITRILRDTSNLFAFSVRVAISATAST